MAKRKLSKQQRIRIQKIQNRRKARASLKKSISDEEILSLGQPGQETLGTVISNFGSQVDIEGLEGPFKGQVYRCHIRANLEGLVTGDIVIWRQADPYGVVVACEERNSELIRPDAYGKLRPVAANIDRIAIVFSAKPTPYSNLIDRYLVAAETQNIQPFLVLNKVDLLDQEDYPEITELLNIYQKVGYDIISVSAKTGAGLNELQLYLSTHTSVFVGQSGVGKSSLINKLQPAANSEVGPLSNSKDKGTHTTTTSRLYHLDGGGVLIDSPGIREFSLSHLSPDKIIHGYIDFQPYLNQCKFRDCQHLDEPDCALLTAVKDGKVLEVRLENFRRILQSLELK